MPITPPPQIVPFLKDLRDRIIAEFEKLEPAKQFQRKHWDHHTGGGGEISLLRGDQFEKAAVNWSAVSGDNFPMQDGTGPFYATGVSLITHMLNPHAPTVHMNIRYIQTANKHWFGGGYDLTPMGFPYEEDKEHFHNVAKKTLLPHDHALYEQFSKNAKDYFYIPHRKKERGVGGLFFDHYNTGNFDKDLAMWQAVGNSLIEAIIPIYQQRITQPFTPHEIEHQHETRAHYVEFNLLYDRGTKFGFLSGGNPEAILCSMPPVAKW
ncbi:MAG: oxygen-dependent coproporphyrinogen oxidase [Parachlamydiaceae bacterium]|nr:oxygen-dependent coproporphyrinogen oxidase [Parachlamydiaceae bacterium]